MRHVKLASTDRKKIQLLTVNGSLINQLYITSSVVLHQLFTPECKLQNHIFFVTVDRSLLYQLSNAESSILYCCLLLKAHYYINYLLLIAHCFIIYILMVYYVISYLQMITNYFRAVYY